MIVTEGVRSITLEEQQANRVKWCQKLRSGEYDQCRGKLRGVDDTFCVLGVGCNVIDPHGWGRRCEVEEGFYDGDEGGDEYLFLGWFDIHMPFEVRVLFGLSEAAEQSLWTRNDALNWSFDKLADYIETLPYVTEEA